MEHSITIHFHIRNARRGKNDAAPIYMRITINGKRYEQSINRWIEPSKWSAATGRLKGTSGDARALNDYIDILKNKVHTVERKMLNDGREINYQTFKENWLGLSVKKQMLFEVFKQHNDEVSKLVGKDFAPSTLQRYKTSFDHTRNFIEWKYKMSDIYVTNLNYEFISSYAFWLKSVRNCNHNSTMKYLVNLKKIVLICLKNGWISKDPFLGFKLTRRQVDRPILSENELQQMVSKKFNVDRLNLVKDIFIFSCYTGLAYAKELQALVMEQKILNRIYVVRGEKIMLDRDLAELYGVSTRYL